MAQPWSSREFQGFTAPENPSLTAHKPSIEATLLSPTHIFVRDPPRNQLCIGSDYFWEDSALLTYFPGQPNDSPINDPCITHLKQYLEPNIVKSARRQNTRMAKRRRSLQSIFTPTFLNVPPSPNDSTIPKLHSYSTTGEVHPFTSNHPADTPGPDSPPPDFLLDEDPFANLSTVPYTSSSRPTTTPAPILSPLLDTPHPKPRSPLTPATPETKASFYSLPSSSISAPKGVSRAFSTRARPAYQKPAFAPRPSLPSLDTLARMNVVLPKKVRKGRVGAGLPFEPWDNLDNDQSSGNSSGSQESLVTSLESSLAVSSNRTNFLTDLELNFLDFSDKDEEDEEDDEIGHPMAFPSHNYLQQSSPTGSYELSYSADSEASLDEDSISAISPTASSILSSLTRSMPLVSASSLEPLGFDAHDTSVSSAEDSDAINSPPDDYTSFPTFHHYPSAVTGPHWSSTAMYDTFELENTVHNDLFSNVNFLSEPVGMHEPGTSAETIRPSMEFKIQSKPLHTSGSQTHEEAVDGIGRDGHQARDGVQHCLNEGGSIGDRDNNNTGGASGRYAGGDGFNGFGGRDDEDDDKRANRSTFSTPSDSDASTSDETEEEDSPDEYGEPIRETNGASSSSDDDVPLAQRIPTALRAQNTIRRQVREEREQRKKARTLRAAKEPKLLPSQQPALLPPGAADPLPLNIMSSSQEAAAHAAKPLRRPRTATASAAETQAFRPEDLTKKLQSTEINVPRHNYSVSKAASVTKRPGSLGRSFNDADLSSQYTPPQSPPLQGSRILRTMRSFHRPEGRKLDTHSVPMPLDPGQTLGRSLTRVPRSHEASTSNGANPRSYPTRISQDETLSKQHSKSGEEPRKHPKAHPEPRSARPSTDQERSPRPSMQRPPVPPLPPDGAIIGSPPTIKGPVTQQRVFIGDMQRFNMVEVSSLTSAGEVIEMIEAQGSLKGWAGNGGWMVWEVAQDFGMERPVRSFELLADVQASWNKDKMLNTFMIKLTPLALPLSLSAIPTASPMHAGYIEWEVKRGKWNKRWLQLREHSLWLSKRDNGRDEIHLCSLSNFDAYFITRLHKAPRPFSFALKSTDNLSFFENAADYLHVFSCGEKEGAIWMEKILLARSYVLHQERHVLFNPKAGNGNAAGGLGSLSRSGTRKAPSQPLISVAPPFMGAQHITHPTDVFEPGSLLRKHG